MPKPVHRTRPLINGKLNSTSLVSLIGDTGDFDFSTWTLNPTVTDNHGGKWKAAASGRGDKKKELRILLTCTTEPTLPAIRKDKPKDDSPDKTGKARDTPPEGTLTITLTMGTMTQTATPPVDYANDPAP